MNPASQRKWYLKNSIKLHLDKSKAGLGTDFNTYYQEFVVGK